MFSYSCMLWYIVGTRKGASCSHPGHVLRGAWSTGSSEVHTHIPPRGSISGRLSPPAAGLQRLARDAKGAEGGEGGMSVAQPGANLQRRQGGAGQRAAGLEGGERLHLLPQRRGHRRRHGPNLVHRRPLRLHQPPQPLVAAGWTTRCNLRHPCHGRSNQQSRGHLVVRVRVTAAMQVQLLSHVWAPWAEHGVTFHTM